MARFMGGKIVRLRIANASMSIRSVGKTKMRPPIQTSHQGVGDTDYLRAQASNQALWNQVLIGHLGLCSWAVVTFAPEKKKKFTIYRTKTPPKPPSPLPPHAVSQRLVLKGNYVQNLIRGLLLNAQ